MEKNKEDPTLSQGEQDVMLEAEKHYVSPSVDALSKQIEPISLLSDHDKEMQLITPSVDVLSEQVEPTLMLGDHDNEMQLNDPLTPHVASAGAQYNSEDNGPTLSLEIE